MPSKVMEKPPTLGGATCYEACKDDNGRNCSTIWLTSRGGNSRVEMTLPYHFHRKN